MLSGFVDGDDVSYETVKTSVPMVFAQKPEYETFGEDVRESNPGLFATNPLLPPTPSMRSEPIIQLCRNCF